MKIKNEDPSTSNGLKRLEHIGLSSNPIKELHDDTFNDLTSLFVIYIYNPVI